MLKGLLGLLAPVAKFIYSVGKKILDAGATFIDFGFKAYDFTRGIVGKLTGDLGLGIFDKLSSTLTIFKSSNCHCTCCFSCCIVTKQSTRYRYNSWNWTW